MSQSIQEKIQKKIETFALELVELLREEHLELVESAWGHKGSSRARTKKTTAKKSTRRQFKAADYAKLKDQAVAYVKRNNGAKAGVIKDALNTSDGRWNRVRKELVEEKRLVVWPCLDSVDT